MRVVNVLMIAILWSCVVARYPYPRIIMLGATGTGKSSLGNILFGKEVDAVSDEHRRDRCFVSGGGTASVTTSTCAEVGKWLGQGYDVTIIDTPGFGDDIKKDEESVDKLVDVLKNDVKYVNAFVILFNGQNPRFTYSLRSMILLFEKMFGSGFWKNVIFEVTRWHFNHLDVERRKETEKDWTRERNDEFEELFNLEKSIDAVFIDSHYNANDSNERNKFNNETNKLWNFAFNAEPFHCKDIKAALSEIQEYLKQLEQLEKELEEERNKPEVTSDEVCVVYGWCFTIPQFGGLGGGMLFLGLLVGVILMCCCQNKCGWDLSMCLTCCCGFCRHKQSGNEEDDDQDININIDLGELTKLETDITT